MIVVYVSQLMQGTVHYHIHRPPQGCTNLVFGAGNKTPTVDDRVSLQPVRIRQFSPDANNNHHSRDNAATDIPWGSAAFLLRVGAENLTRCRDSRRGIAPTGRRSACGLGIRKHAGSAPRHPLSNKIHGQEQQ
jgi:hypothetical protein